MADSGDDGGEKLGLGFAPGGENREERKCPEQSRRGGFGPAGSRWRGGMAARHGASVPWRHSEKRGKRERLTVGDPLSVI